MENTKQIITGVNIEALKKSNEYLTNIKKNEKSNKIEISQSIEFYSFFSKYCELQTLLEVIEFIIHNTGSTENNTHLLHPLISYAKAIDFYEETEFLDALFLDEYEKKTPISELLKSTKQ